MARRTILPVLLLIISIILFYILYPFDSNQESVKEDFIVSPIRAKDCRCLPGYIPSNFKNGKIQSFYFCQKLGSLNKTMKCY
jgi:hypothetical protein